MLEFPLIDYLDSLETVGECVRFVQNCKQSNLHDFSKEERPDLIIQYLWDPSKSTANDAVVIAKLMKGCFGTDAMCGRRSLISMVYYFSNHIHCRIGTLYDAMIEVGF